MNRLTNLAVDPREELAAWWQAYLACYAALQLAETMGDTQRERTAVERADLAMRVWQNKMRAILNTQSDTSIAEQIYLQERRRAELEGKAADVAPVPITPTPALASTLALSSASGFVNGDHVPEKNPQ